MLTVLLVACRPAATPNCYPPAVERSYVDTSAVVQQVDDLVGAPRGATGSIEASSAELSAYLTGDVLSLAGASGYRADVVLAPDIVTAVMRDAAARQLAAASASVGGSAGLHLTSICVGPLRLASPLVSLADRVLAATLGSGELGVGLVDARVAGDRLYLTLKRY